MTVSVAMAAYNGEHYIAEQIDSILPQLQERDELVISINPSQDRTEEIVRGYAARDHRVRYDICGQKGVLSNFENAIAQCKNDIIFLSDQDDIWATDKVSRQLSLFDDPAVGGVCHGCVYIDDGGRLTDDQPGRGKTRDISVFEIIKKNPVQGSCLAFRKEMRERFLPFPERIPMHDSWIGMVICRNARLVYLDEALLLYRQHEGTLTTRKHNKIGKMASDRLCLLSSLLSSKQQIKKPG